MKTPEGTVDLIGTGMQIGLGVIDLVKTFAPTADQRAENRKQHKINVAIRRLKHRFKRVPVEAYVKVNFPEMTENERLELITMLRSTLQRI